MRWAGRFLIVLALLTLGCARGDWISETLTLVDVTGTWEGLFRVDGYRIERTIRYVLQQKGEKVRGEVQGADGAPIASIEGLVNGEVFSWRLTGPFIVITGGGYSSSRSYDGETPVINDELNGPVHGPGCPCTLLLRRMNTEAIKEKQQM
jgi:hypothetical protein